MSLEVGNSFPAAVSDLWDPPRLRFLVALATFYPPPSCGVPRPARRLCGVLVSAALLVNVVLSLFVLGIYPSRHGFASSTDFCHSMCSLVSHAVLVYLLETQRLEKLLCVPEMDSLQDAMTTCNRRFRRLLIRTPLSIYPFLGLLWWLTHFLDWMPGGLNWQRFGEVGLLCAVINTLTAWVWYSGPVCVIMLTMSILLVHEASLGHIMDKLSSKSMLPSRAAVVYDGVLRSLEASMFELQIPLGFFLMVSLLALATMAASLLFPKTDDQPGTTWERNAEEMRVVLQTCILVGLTLLTFMRGAHFTSKAGRTELSANSRLLHQDIAETFSEALAVQQMQRQRGAWIVWGVRVDHVMMVKICSIYAAATYYLVTASFRYYHDRTPKVVMFT